MFKSRKLKMFTLRRQNQEVVSLIRLVFAFRKSCWNLYQLVVHVMHCKGKLIISHHYIHWKNNLIFETKPTEGTNSNSPFVIYEKLWSCLAWVLTIGLPRQYSLLDKFWLILLYVRNWWHYCKALCDVKFRQMEGNGRKFRHIYVELSNSVIS